MKYKFFYIPVIDSGVSAQELNSFCAGHRVLSIEKEFVSDGQNSFWSVCISYMEGNPPVPGSGRTRVDYREVLNDKDFAVFAKLRTLRKSFSEKEGVPA